MNSLKFSSIRHHYGNVTALDGLDFEVNPGSVAGLVGHNGAGKSTLLLLAGGMIMPDEGSVTVGDRAASQPEVRRSTGLLSEHLRLYPRFTVGDYCNILMRLYERSLDEGRQLWDEFGLLEYWSRPVGALSTGMARRLALASAVIDDPDVVLLDEPFANLDPPSVEFLITKLLEWRTQGKVVLIASHDLAELQAVIDDLIVIQNGRVLAAGRLEALLRDRGLVPSLHLRTSSGTVTVPAEGHELLECVRQLVESKSVINSVALSTPSLGELYARLHAEPTPVDEAR